MSAQYDDIAAQYVRTKASPLGKWVEQPSFLAMADPVASA